MNNYTVYRSARGRGKTSWIISQIAGLHDTADGPLRIALIVPTRNLEREFVHVPVEIFTEQTVLNGNARGNRYDYVFVDNADLFYEHPFVLCDEVAPGIPAFLTYTPFEGSSLPLPTPHPESEPDLIDDEIMMLTMLAYIWRDAE